MSVYSEGSACEGGGLASQTWPLELLRNVRAPMTGGTDHVSWLLQLALPVTLTKVMTIFSGPA